MRECKEVAQVRDSRTEAHTNPTPSASKDNIADVLKLVESIKRTTIAQGRSRHRVLGYDSRLRKELSKDDGRTDASRTPSCDDETISC